MKLTILLLINVLIVALFLHTKLTPHKIRLTDSYLRIFNFFEAIFNPILNLLRKIAHPVQVGNGIALDMSPIFLLGLLLISLNYLL